MGGLWPSGPRRAEAIWTDHTVTCHYIPSLGLGLSGGEGHLMETCKGQGTTLGSQSSFTFFLVEAIFLFMCCLLRVRGPLAFFYLPELFV